MGTNVTGHCSDRSYAPNKTTISGGGADNDASISNGIATESNGDNVSQTKALPAVDAEKHIKSEHRNIFTPSNNFQSNSGGVKVYRRAAKRMAEQQSAKDCYGQ